MWREEAGKVVSRLDNKDRNLRKRINTFIYKFGYSSNQVEDKIRLDEMFASHFAKEPRRTGFHERLAAEWISELENVSNFATLPKTGPDAIYVTSDGEFRRGMSNAPTKSLDFIWATGKTTFFATHKYTKESGGTQDNQFKDVRDMLALFQSTNTTSDVALVAIVDGPYYTSRRMAQLLRFVRDRHPKSFALQIEDLPPVLEGFT